MRSLKTFGRALGLLGSDLGKAILLGGANLLVAALQFLDPVLFGRVIGLLSRSDTLPRQELWSAATALIGIWVAVGATGIGSNIAVALLAERLAHRHRLQAMHRYFVHVLRMPLAFHGETHSGRLMRTMLAGTEALFAGWLTVFRDQLASFFAILVLLPLTLVMNWRLGLVLILLIAAVALVTILVIRRTQAGQKQAQFYQTTLAGRAQDALANVMVVQSFGRLRAEATVFGDIVRQVIAHQFPVLNWWAVVNVMTRAANTIAIISIVVVGTVLHLNGEASVAEIVSFMGFAGLLIGKLESAIGFVSRTFLQLPDLEHFFAVLDSRSSVPERPGAVPLVVTEGKVAFEDVSFAYPGGPLILSGVSFTAAPGTSVALVGPTGAGKSTAMALLQRHWDPIAGRVLIDGQDLRDVTLESVQRAIGVVFQESLLFNRSIRENLLVGRLEATEQELERACRLADAHEFIIRQPQGYDTMVGERGATLSGGQRQRLAIARALLKDPPLLILDEATSALDAATEARVSRALRSLMAGRTTFIIAHRLSTVRDADMILVFDGGRIVERGRYEELLAAGGRFAELVATQLAPAPPLQARAAE